jgi:hypothetical protein
MPDNEKDPASFATPGAIHQGVGHASMAKESCSIEHNGKVGIVYGGQFVCPHHHLERFDSVSRSGNTLGVDSGRGSPCSNTRDDQSGNCKQVGRAHLGTPANEPRRQLN